MLYLSRFTFPTYEQETNFRFSIRRNCYDSQYPFGILSQHKLHELNFEPITILYGGNGSGKSTALNVICEKLGLGRDSLYNRSSFYEDYLGYCDFESCGDIPRKSCIITSDDVFDFMLNLRSINNGIDLRREELFEEYNALKNTKFQFNSLEDYEQLKLSNMAKSKTQSKFVRANLVRNAREHSNGESSSLYFSEKIKENALYLLDEPENSLSPARQMELHRFIEDSARFFGCQFIIATHSPFILSLKGARIYDLDEDPVDIKKWTELESVQTYYDFFKSHESEF